MSTTANSYQDVSTEDRFYPAVEYMSGKGYMTGYSTTKFGPNDTLSRAMFVTVLYRISGEQAKTVQTNFTDVPQNTWYSEAVAWAVENGITTGTTATKFSPNTMGNRCAIFQHNNMLEPVQPLQPSGRRNWTL